ncbi:UNVERIFIED_CONTAM: hypothetical protein FKN15_022720 [Acipenser sinensis]
MNLNERSPKCGALLLGDNKQARVGGPQLAGRDIAGQQVEEGSVTAMTVFYPLDSARLRLQVDEKRKAKWTPAVLVEIIREEGLLAPYRGWFPVICSLCCSNFVYFYTFNSVKACWLRGHRSTPGKDLVLGIIAGVVNVLVTTPLWVVNTRLKLQGAKFRNSDIKPTHYSGILDAFRQILLSEGLPTLWNGTLPSLLLVLNPALQFMVYEGLKRELRRVGKRGVKALPLGAQDESHSLDGSGSRPGCAKKPNFAGDLDGKPAGTPSPHRTTASPTGQTRSTFRVVKRQGWSLFSGIGSPSTSGLLSFFSLEVFVIGAIAKAVATTATYPLQTVQSILRCLSMDFIFSAESLLAPSMDPDEEGVVAMVIPGAAGHAPTLQSEAVTNELQELSLHPAPKLLPLRDRKNGECNKLKRLIVKLLR